MAERERRTSAGTKSKPPKPTKPSTGRPRRASEGSGGVRRELVEHELLKEATRLFSERGFAGTTLQDLANAVGLSRPSLYHYVRSKDELLERLMEDITTRPAQEALSVYERNDLDPAQKLELLIRNSVRRVSERPDQFRLIERSGEALPPHLASEHLRARRTTLNVYSGVIREGVKSGHFRSVDERTAALALLGMTNWVAWWFQPGPEHPVAPVEDHLAEIAMLGLRNSDAAESESGEDHVAAVIARLRRDVDELERSLRDPT